MTYVYIPAVLKNNLKCLELWHPGFIPSVQLCIMVRKLIRSPETNPFVVPWREKKWGKTPRSSRKQIGGSPA